LLRGASVAVNELGTSWLLPALKDEPEPRKLRRHTKIESIYTRGGKHITGWRSWRGLWRDVISGEKATVATGVSMPPPAVQLRKGEREASRKTSKLGTRLCILPSLCPRSALCGVRVHFVELHSSLARRWMFSSSSQLMYAACRAS
jgi:hypothetical protein